MLAALPTLPRVPGKLGEPGLWGVSDLLPHGSAGDSEKWMLLPNGCSTLHGILSCEVFLALWGKLTESASFPKRVKGAAVVVLFSKERHDDLCDIMV